MNSSGFGKQMIPGSLPAPADAGALAALAPVMPPKKKKPKKKFAPPAPAKKAKAKLPPNGRPTKSAWIGRKPPGSFGAM